jgi:hypothetical protein
MAASNPPTHKGLAKGATETSDKNVLEKDMRFLGKNEYGSVKNDADAGQKVQRRQNFTEKPVYIPL